MPSMTSENLQHERPAIVPYAHSMLRQKRFGGVVGKCHPRGVASLPKVPDTNVVIVMGSKEAMIFCALTTH
eukprot:1577050-Lingulodinium_polyedra.AAC.1